MYQEGRVPRANWQVKVGGTITDTIDDCRQNSVCRDRVNPEYISLPVSIWTALFFIIGLGEWI